MYKVIIKKYYAYIYDNGGNLVMKIPNKHGNVAKWLEYYKNDVKEIVDKEDEE